MAAVIYSTTLTDILFLTCVYLLAAGVIALLDEPEDQLKVYALRRLNDIVPEFWPEISDHVEKMFVYLRLLKLYALFFLE